MIRWQVGEVEEIVAEQAAVQELLVRLEGRVEKAWSFPDLIGPVAKGDAVLLNTTAVHLKLGTGGYHLVAQRLGCGDAGGPGQFPRPPSSIRGHIMKLRYTPYQMAVQSCEEQASPCHETLKDATTLDGMPVLIGELHSMLPILVTGIQWLKRTHRLPSGVRIVYIMSDGGALPLAMSRHVQTLQALGWLAGTVTYGHAFGGQLEAVNVYTALLAAKHVLKADVAVMMMGPGTVGTGTKWGFSGVEVAEMIHATFSLEGRPCLVPRISFADGRRRHQGISHHQQTLITKAIHVPFTYSVPPYHGREEQVIRKQLEALAASKAFIERRAIMGRDEMEAMLALYPGGEITVMGRTAKEDPAYFWGVVHGLAPLLH